MTGLVALAKMVVGAAKGQINAIESGADDLRAAKRDSYLEELFLQLGQAGVDEVAAYLEAKGLPFDRDVVAAAFEANDGLFTHFRSDSVADPTASEGYQALAHRVAELAREVELSDAQTAEIQIEMRLAYQKSFYERLRSNRSVESFAMAEANHPLRAALDQERAWAAYDRRLCHQIREPVLVEDLWVERTYVPLKGMVAEPLDPAVRNPSAQVRHGQPVGELLDRWIEAADPDDPIRLLLGGPGSGKSTELKMLAVRLLRQADVRVVFVPLNRFGLDKDIGKALGDYLNINVGPVTNPWKRSGGLRRFLFIFDGLDELALQGPEAFAEAEQFPRRLRDSLPREIEGVRGLVQCIVSGRHLAIDALQGQFPAEAFVHVLPMHIWQAQERSELRAYFEDDLRDRLWDRFAEIDGRVPEGMPEILTNVKFRDLTDSPITNVLLWTAYRVHGDELGLWNRSRLFEMHTKEVFVRRYNRAESPTRLRFDEYFAAMREAAICAWPQGGRTFRLDCVAARCRDTALNDALGAIVRPDGQPGPGLLAFYVWSATGSLPAQPTVEFVLKPFADFLIARRLVAEVLEQPGTGRPITVARPRGEAGLKGFADLAVQGTITTEIASFISSELYGLDAALTRELRDRALSWLAEAMGTGLFELKPADGPQTTQVQRVLAALTTLISAASQALQEVADMPWGDSRHAAAQLIASASSISRNPGQNPIRGALTWLDFQSQDLSGADLRVAELSRSNLNEIKAEGTCLFDAQMNFVWAEGADFQHANLSRAQMAYAHARGADFCFATMTSCNLERADLRDGAFLQAGLRNANFFLADLRGASLKEALLRGANLEGAVVGDVEGSDVQFMHAYAEEELLDQSVRLWNPEAQDYESTTLRRLGWMLYEGRMTK